MPSPLRESGRTRAATAAAAVDVTPKIAPCRKRSPKTAGKVRKKKKAVMMRRNAHDPATSSLCLFKESMIFPANGRHKTVPS